MHSHLFYKRLTAAVLAACLLLCGSAAVAYDPPVGIPEPSFGIDETVENVYGSADYYTYYVDNTHPSATDSSNPNGSPTTPRMSMPTVLTAGDVVQVHGGPYSVGSQGRFRMNGHGTLAQPIIITGRQASVPPELRLVIHISDASYMIVEGFKIVTSAGAVDIRPEQENTPIDHVSIRYMEVDGRPDGNVVLRGNQGIGAFSLTANSEVTDLVIFRNFSHDIGDISATLAGNQDDSNSFGLLQHVHQAWILENESTRAAGDSVAMGNNADFLGSHIYVGRNHLYHNGENAIDIKEMTDVIISENVFNDFRSTATSTGEAAAIHFGPRRIWFINNTIYDSEIALISTGSEEAYFIGNVVFDLRQSTGTFNPLSAFSLGSGIHVRGATDTYILNNTIYDYDMGIQVPSGGPTYIYNNIMANRNQAASFDLLHSATLGNGSEAGNNLYFPNNGPARIGWGGGSELSLTEHQSQNGGSGAGSVEFDPQFLDPDNTSATSRDFSILATSPARDTGSGGVSTRLQEAMDRFQTLYGVSLSRDIADFPRTFGATVDIGAREYNPDSDLDGLNDDVDPDDDNDGTPDVSDAFPLNSAESIDTDGDSVGNNADTDDDGDGVLDADDAFPLDAAETLDTDNDGIGNNADPDADGDGTDDSIDTDDDNDGVPDTSDAFPSDPAETLDTDSDGIGNNADTDDDGDGALDDDDAFPLNAAESVDTDGDGTGNNADPDDDGDGVPDGSDALPLDGTETIDTDGDGIGDNADTDDDGDGTFDVSDAFPLDPTENADPDGDGIGNNTDDDDDNDGVLDGDDDFPEDASRSVSLYQPPVGIPVPPFGIEETIESVYGSADYYTYYIDNTHPSATDTNNPNGSPSMPRMNFPGTLAAGDVMQVHGGPYNVGTQGRFRFNGPGTLEQPIFISGRQASSPPELQLVSHISDASYLVLEGFKIVTSAGAVDIRPENENTPIHHVSVRYNEVDGRPGGNVVLRGNQGIGAFSLFENSQITNVVIYRNFSHDIGDIAATIGGTQDDSNSFGVLTHAHQIWILEN